MLAAAELEGASGSSVLRGLAVGVEILCRLSLVVPKAVHQAGFHPTAVFGAPAAAAAVASTLRLEMSELVDALGISGSMASGIIEYLAEGTWTKRMHPGWAAHSGLRAALLGRAGFKGPRTVFEGTHGLFHGFARTREGDYAALLDGFGERWVTPSLAFKPYPCGTMIQPYIDCARRLRERVSTPGDIAGIQAIYGARVTDSSQTRGQGVSVATASSPEIMPMPTVRLNQMRFSESTVSYSPSRFGKLLTNRLQSATKPS